MDLSIKTTELFSSKNIWASTQGRRYSTITIDMTTVAVDPTTQTRLAKAGTAFAKLANGMFAPYDVAQFGVGQNAPIYYIDKNFDCTKANQVVQAAYSGALKTSRLLTAPDNNIKTSMRTMDFR